MKAPFSMSGSVPMGHSIFENCRYLESTRNFENLSVSSESVRQQWALGDSNPHKELFSQNNPRFPRSPPLRVASSTEEFADGYELSPLDLSSKGYLVSLLPSSSFSFLRTRDGLRVCTLCTYLCRSYNYYSRRHKWNNNDLQTTL